MKPWILVFRVKKAALGGMMPRGLKRDIGSTLRVEASYAANLSGVRLVGFEVLVKEEEFYHITRVIRILEARHGLSLFEFSAKNAAESNAGISIKIGSKPTLNVA
ncbi:hypothetical protein SAMN05661010_01802 [Modicisalibacter muralis]|uniref:Uncharacterized protein n=1 Tax=Modicisalibacter muralis TaxID=119000 RepID=A0A1G9KK09_9GAMM|nr:hypothetical protein [Halomonas muralis]SDL49745.1 hypothetical protein SAMN05661010_01802 [Halomonas muralis]